MSNSASDQKRVRTAMKEAPILTEEGYAEMLASLKDAEARLAAGQYTEYDPLTFRDRLLAIFRAAKASGLHEL